MQIYTDSGAHSKERCSGYWENRKVIFICFLWTLALFQYYFDQASVNAFQAMPGFLKVFGFPSKTSPNGLGIDPTFQSLITSFLFLSQIIASLLIGVFSSKFGRRVGIWVGSVFIVAGLLVQIFVTTHGAYYVGRLLLGFGNGFYTNIAILYIVEASPAHLRGFNTSMYQVTQNFGGLLAAIISNFTAKIDSRLSYQIPCAILLIVPVFMTTMMFFVPESPRWLTLQGRHEQAMKSLRFLRGKAFAEDLLLEEMMEIREVCEAEKEAAKSATFRDMFRGTDLRRTLLSCGAALTHQASGVLILVGYITYIFQVSGWASSAFQYTIIYQVLGLVGSFAGIFIIRGFGRRPVIILGASITTLCTFLVALIWSVTLGQSNLAAGKAMAAFVFIFGIAYSFSIGPLGWVLASEIPSNRLRAQTTGFALGFSFVFSFLSQFTAPYELAPLGVNLGLKIDWIYFGSNVLMLAFLIFCMPETKGRSLEELDYLFLRRVSAWRFKSHPIPNLQEIVDAEGHEKAACQCREKW